MEILTEYERDLIRLLADADLNVNAAARAAFRHRNTVIYHIEKIKKKTGLNPQHFRDCVKLLNMIETEENHE